MTRVAVAIDAPQYAGMSSLLTYESEQALVPGTLARVPLGRREVTGLVWDADFSAIDAAAAELAADGDERAARWCCARSSRRMDSLPPLPADWRALVEFTARYYQRSLGEVALAVLPPELRKLDNTAIAKRIKKKRDHLIPEASGDAAQRPAADARAVDGDGHARGLGRRAGAAADAAVRRHRQRQDRGLPAPGRAGARGRQAGADPGARDQPDAAARATLRRALSRPPPRLAAQRADAGPAAAALALGAPGRGRPRARHAAGGVRVAAAAGPDRGRRGARPVVQAAGRRALLGARPGRLPRPPGAGAGAARLGHAVAGDLVARADRPLPPGDAVRARRAAARCPRCACWTWPPCRAPRRARRRRRWRRS